MRNTIEKNYPKSHSVASDLRQQHWDKRALMHAPPQKWRGRCHLNRPQKSFYSILTTRRFVISKRTIHDSVAQPRVIDTPAIDAVVLVHIASCARQSFIFIVFTNSRAEIKTRTQQETTSESMDEWLYMSPQGKKTTYYRRQHLLKHITIIKILFTVVEVFCSPAEI